MAREPFSAVLVTLNEAPRLAACLETLHFADEILVVDSGSSDDTVAIAERYGARVIDQPWLGFGPQKHFAVEHASHDWVLCVDADERVSPELRASIEEALMHQRAKACRLTRRNRFLGHWLRHGEGYPDYVVRLFHREHAQWSDDPVHETVLANETPLITLYGDLLHESEDGVCDYALKQVRYARLQAERLRAAGWRSSPFKVIGSPLARFVKFYIIRLGFLDGLPGFAHIALGCLASFLKHLELTRSLGHSGDKDCST